MQRGRFAATGPAPTLSWPATTILYRIAGGRQRTEGRHMQNQHVGLSQLLAAQRSSEHHEQAAQARLVPGARPPRRRRPSRAPRWD